MSAGFVEGFSEGWLRHYATSRKVAGSRPDEVNYFCFSIYLILPAALGPGVHSVCNINEYHKQKIMFSGSKNAAVRKADSSACCILEESGQIP
jgi:hypothetical protein